ncbi:MAG: hypothetical protein DELT_01859 [Desulfovibrio sp.]
MTEPVKTTAALMEKADAQCAETLSKAMLLLRQCLYSGRHDAIPDELQQFEDFVAMLRYLQLIQKYIVFMTRGEINEPVPLVGYTGTILKELQNNLQQVVLKARRLTVADFSSDAGNMGEISEALDIMGKALQSALSRLERQKADLTELSLNLQREVDARIHVEESLRLEQIRLQKLASTDSLTGLANRRYFFQIAVREIERIRRTGSKACLAMLDIDHFKTLNDTLGHSAGDKALKHIAQAISTLIRPYDLVGRYGGDEFIFLFPETGREVALTILERLRDSVERARIHAGKGESYITVSIGLTELDSEAESSDASLDAAIAKADEALYNAKGNSRNHICIV